MRDLIGLAAAGSQPGELGRIYEWYSARTVRAISTSYAVAAAALGALLHHVLDAEPDNVLVVILLGLGVVLAAVVGLFQHAELAQLPRELAEATRLVATFSSLKEAGVDLGTPKPADVVASGPRWLAGLRGFVVCVFAVLAVGKMAGAFEIAAAAIACIVLPVLWARLCAELEPSPEPPSEEERELDQDSSLIWRIGRYRLDDYVSQQDIATYVDTCIEDAAARRGATRPDTARRRRYGRRAR